MIHIRNACSHQNLLTDAAEDWDSKCRASNVETNYNCMSTVELHGTPYYIAIAPTPEISAEDLEEVRLTLVATSQDAQVDRPTLPLHGPGSQSDEDAIELQVRRLHKQCWPGEHDEEEDSIAGFLHRATFLLDADTVTWLLLWEHAQLHR